jgi:hypothetical protein
VTGNISVPRHTAWIHSTRSRTLRAAGAYATTQVHASLTAATTFASPDWPSRLGVKRRDRDSPRSQVIALFRDQPRRRERRSAGGDPLHHR